ncbi:MAG: hypothetical protein IKU43_01515 [Clostridia bacterium]|nr:hypothetical protein [Clostridia bacterium]
MKLNKIFSSHMVLKANSPIRIFGEGAGEVTVKFNGTAKSVTSDGGKWIAEFPEMTYGGPYTLEADFGDRTEVYEDIYVGEVFLFSGQSNMAFRMKEESTPSENYKSCPMLRLFETGMHEDESFTEWLVCDKESVDVWTAIGYLTGMELARKLGVAVGVIVCAKGASIIESWLPAGTLEKIGINIPIEEKHGDHTYEPYIEWNSEEAYLYNNMLMQIAPYGITGVIWYQGESDSTVAEALVYCDELCELIRIWRCDFKNENLPFIIIQLADYDPRTDDGWTLIQKAQSDIQQKMNGVTTVISKDVCESNNIHPQTKSGIAHRVSRVILDEFI